MIKATRPINFNTFLRLWLVFYCIWITESNIHFDYIYLWLQLTCQNTFNYNLSLQFIVPKVVYTVKKCSWGWANLSPETCRAYLKRLINEKFVILLVAYIVVLVMHGHTNIKHQVDKCCKATYSRILKLFLVHIQLISIHTNYIICFFSVYSN